MNYDIVICGAGPSGICCALACAKEKQKVLLIENSSLLGGTNVLSLVTPLMTFHNQSKQVIGGIAQDIVSKLVLNKATLGHIDDPLGFCSTVTPVDVEGLKALYFDLIGNNEYIDLLLNTKVVGVESNDGYIGNITIANKGGVSKITAKIFVDATGDGDICGYAGFKYTLGRTLDNLCQPFTLPFIVAGVDIDKLKCAMKDNPLNFVIRNNYDYKYVGISGFFDEVKKAKSLGEFNFNRDRVLLFENVRSGEVTINMTRLQGYNPLNQKELTKAEIEGRSQIKECMAFLKKYIPGFENSYILATPSQIGVRESRHVECLYMVTKEDVLNHTEFYDSICVSAFPMDIHSPNGESLEVDEVKENLAFEVPLRSIIPVNSKNLIVTGRAIGATHEASASMRVSPVCMALGEASGVLAYLAVKQNKNISDVSYKDVQNILIKNKAILKIKGE